MQIPAIDYLRWIRQPSTHEGVRYSFVLSGMSPPDGEFLRGIPPEELICGFGVDHPLLAHRIAADLGRSSEEVVVQPGSHWNLVLAVAARLDQRRGPVIVEEPAYEPLRRIPGVMGVEILRLPRRLADGRMKLDLQHLAALAERSPSLLVLSHPHNPTMSSLSLREMEELAAWSRTSGCAVLSDEVYLEFLPDETRHSLHEVLPEAAVIRSFTKVMGLGSIRCSVLICDRKWSAGALKLSDYGPAFLPMPSQAMALRAWEQRECFVREGQGTRATAAPSVESLGRRAAGPSGRRSRGRGHHHLLPPATRGGAGCSRKGASKGRERALRLWPRR